MEEGIWDTKIVAHVRDIFDLHSSRPSLNNVFLFASNDVVFGNEVGFFFFFFFSFNIEFFFKKNDSIKFFRFLWNH